MRLRAGVWARKLPGEPGPFGGTDPVGGGSPAVWRRIRHARIQWAAIFRTVFCLGTGTGAGAGSRAFGQPGIVFATGASPDRSVHLHRVGPPGHPGGRVEPVALDPPSGFGGPPGGAARASGGEAGTFDGLFVRFDRGAGRAVPVPGAFRSGDPAGGIRAPAPERIAALAGAPGAVRAAARDAPDAELRAFFCARGMARDSRRGTRPFGITWLPRPGRRP